MRVYTLHFQDCLVATPSLSSLHSLASDTAPEAYSDAILSQFNLQGSLQSLQSLLSRRSLANTNIRNFKN